MNVLTADEGGEMESSPKFSTVSPIVLGPCAGNADMDEWLFAFPAR